MRSSTSRYIGGSLLVVLLLLAVLSLGRGDTAPAQAAVPQAEAITDGSVPVAARHDDPSGAQDAAWGRVDDSGGDSRTTTLFSPLAAPIVVRCGEPEVSGWTVVVSYLISSLCGTDWTCWSNWIGYDPSNALMEEDGTRFYLGHGVATPAGFPAHGYIYDPRVKCADDVWAAGWWYHNAHARAYWRYVVLPGDPPYLECTWLIDPNYKHSSSFGEDDNCPPSCDLDPEATPPATVCVDPPPVIVPPTPPPTPEPQPCNPPEIRPYAWVRATRGNGVRYRTSTDRAFYWPWGMYLNISFSAEIEEPTSGCAASTVVTRYKFLGEGSDRDLCNIDDDTTGTVAGMVCLPTNGKCCLWHTPEQEIHLLFSDKAERQPSAQDDSIFIYGKKPGPVNLHVYVETVTTYTCAGDPPGATRQIPHYAYGNLTVILAKTAPQPPQP